MPICVASGCINAVAKKADNDVIFHRFPCHNPVLLAKWVTALGREDWSPTKQSCLCSDHFTPKDYQRSNAGSLKENAVPSKFKRLMSTRIRNSDSPVIAKGMPKPQVKRIRTSLNASSDEQESKTGNKTGRRSLPGKRKIEESSEEPEIIPPSRNTKRVVANKKSEKIVIKEENTSGTKSDDSVIETSFISTKTTDTKTQPAAKRSVAKPTVKLASNPDGSVLIPDKPKRKGHRKILKLSSDESDNDVQLYTPSLRENMSDASVQFNKEVLAAVRIELSDDLSDNERPELIFEKWVKNKLGSRASENNSSLGRSTDQSNSEKNDDQAQSSKSSGPVPADMDHVVAVNERRTRYRYIYRVGQCFPEDDDDIPFIRSKLTFVIKALESQNEKLRSLQKRCRELSRSNGTLRDILGIPSTDGADEMEEEEEEQQQAYLIIGSHPSTSAALPSYRFTLTDRSPTTFSQPILK